MLLMIDVSDEYVPSLNMHLATQNRIDTDPVTGGQTVTPLYPGGIPEFIRQTVGQIVHATAERFPVGAFREKLLARKTLLDDMSAMTRPKVTVADEATVEMIAEAIAAKATPAA